MWGIKKGGLLRSSFFAEAPSRAKAHINTVDFSLRSAAPQLDLTCFLKPELRRVSDRFRNLQSLSRAVTPE